MTSDMCEPPFSIYIIVVVIVTIIAIVIVIAIVTVIVIDLSVEMCDTLLFRFPLLPLAP